MRQVNSYIDRLELELTNLQKELEAVKSDRDNKAAALEACVAEYRRVAGQLSANLTEARQQVMNLRLVVTWAKRRLDMRCESFAVEVVREFDAVLKSELFGP